MSITQRPSGPRIARYSQQVPPSQVMQLSEAQSPSPAHGWLVARRHSPLPSHA